MNKLLSGFTLLEVLVVAGITVVLISIALPVANKFLQRAESMACAGNLRSLGLAVTAYVGENNGMLPGPTSGTQYGFYTAGNVRNPHHLIAFLAPYLDLPTEPAVRQFPLIASCPTARKRAIRESGGLNTDNARFFSTHHTVMKDGTEQRPFGYEVSGSTTIPPVKAVMVRQPHLTVALTDRNFTNHGGTMNVLFFDGHVESLNNQQIFHPRTGRIQLVNQP